MLYDLNDIDYIVVPRAFQLKAEKLVDGLRAVVKIYEDDMEEFWKNEEHAGVKEMKKAFYDILILN